MGLSIWQLLIVALVIIVLFGIVALLAPFLAPYDPYRIDATALFAQTSPSMAGLEALVGSPTLNRHIKLT